MRKSDYDIFVEKFQPELDEYESIKLYETYGEDYNYVRENSGEKCEFLWTIIESDNGNLYISPGFHLVNRMNYILARIPWEENQRDYKY